MRATNAVRAGRSPAAMRQVASCSPGGVRYVLIARADLLLLKIMVVLGARPASLSC